MNKEDLPLPGPGKMILEIIKEDAVEWINKQRGIDKCDFLSQAGFTVENGEMDRETGELKIKSNSGLTVPYQKGVILNKSPDAFGECWRRRYGSEYTAPEVGDTVLFVRNQSYIIDIEENFHIIDDQHVIAHHKGRKE